ncbi:hypothetical protein LRP50_13765 [Enterovibrio sp. ZSDZ42]|uniref:Uncharacterized protein n=1 Tax=Enterovibrio gelatinilyticus TaxID=2899819 RepID=A0ABT5R1Q4_9GAMM|nr:hypothetical protein [Enterovibrio sp. ZSDZ42]MDD1794203.1 hypothetical protein [Enterovibrio sp. ZSDZ42]
MLDVFFESIFIWESLILFFDAGILLIIEYISIPLFFVMVTPVIEGNTKWGVENVSDKFGFVIGLVYCVVALTLCVIVTICVPIIVWFEYGLASYFDVNILTDQLTTRTYRTSSFEYYMPRWQYIISAVIWAPIVHYAIGNIVDLLNDRIEVKGARKLEFDDFNEKCNDWIKGIPKLIFHYEKKKIIKVSDACFEMDAINKKFSSDLPKRNRSVEKVMLSCEDIIDSDKISVFLLDVEVTNYSHGESINVCFMCKLTAVFDNENLEIKYEKKIDQMYNFLIK